MFESVCSQAVKRAQKKAQMTLSTAAGSNTADRTASHGSVSSLLFFTPTT